MVPALDGTTPAWTENGRPVPFTSFFGDPSPPDIKDARIPVERFKGALFLVCGEE